MTSWKAEVIADSSGKWFGNELRFATEEEAKQYAIDLASRWTLVTDWRVVESDDPVNRPKKVEAHA
jgi:hypothetical protein